MRTLWTEKKKLKKGLTKITAIEYLQNKFDESLSCIIFLKVNRKLSL